VRGIECPDLELQGRLVGIPWLQESISRTAVRLKIDGGFVCVSVRSAWRTGRPTRPRTSCSGAACRHSAGVPVVCPTIGKTFPPAARAVVLHFGSKLSRDVLFSDRLERLPADARHQDAGCLRKNFSFFGCLSRTYVFAKAVMALISINRAAVVALRYFAFALILSFPIGVVVCPDGHIRSDDR
jgi:hypothetical protein